MLEIKPEVKTTGDLLRLLARSGIKLRAEGGTLHYQGPKGSMTRGLQRALADRKQEILEFLADGDTPTACAASGDPTSPLSFSQERLWFLDQLTPGNIAYNVPAALRLTGALDTTALENSFQEILRRHEVLRTCFPSAKEGRPTQKILAPRAPLIRTLDLRSLGEQEQSTQAAALVREAAETPFDLAAGPLVRVALLCLGPEAHILLVTLHHIVSDGWSMGVLVTELSALYTAYTRGHSPALPELPMQYADFARWQRQTFRPQAIEGDLAFWKQQLHGAPSLLELPLDRPRPALQSFHGALVHFQFEPGLTRTLTRIRRESGGTLFMTLLAGFALLLYRYSHQKDLVIGAPVANRDLLETESLIGFFVNTLALRMDLSADPEVMTFLGQVRRTALDAFAHQALPFERLVEALQPERNLSHTPMIQVMFVLQNAPLEPLQLPGLQVEPMAVAPRAAKMDLTLSIQETEQGLQGTLEYNTDLFLPDTAQQMIRRFGTLLQAMAENPHEKISRIPMLTQTEQQQILFEWGRGPVDLVGDAWVGAEIEQWAQKRPHAPALAFEAQTITYRQLAARTHRLARRLRALGVAPEERVGIMLRRGPDMVVAILAVFKAGGAYVPLDPEYPEPRLAFMIRDACPRVLLTQKELATRLPPHAARVVCLDEALSAAPEAPSPAANVDEDNLAYVIYTSGTTGTPKGVMISHHGLGNLARAHIRRYHVGPDSRVLQFASFSFDASVSELVMTLCAGATLVMADPREMLPGPDLARLLRDKTITHVTLPPSALAVMPEGQWPHWQTLIVAGEACPPDLARQWAQGRRLINGYGPTEFTVCATTHEYMPDEQRLPVGRPMDHARVYIVDADLQPVPPTVSGELLIGGPGLARGYWGRPDLSAEKFIPDPFSREPGARLYKTGDLARFLADGRIEYLGRMDQQVKIRGFRVEPAEIEAMLNRHAAVNTSAVMARKGRDGDLRLCAYIVPRSRLTPPDAFRDHLRESLPAYMVPSFFVILDTMPLTPSGKIDRDALPDPGEETVRETYAAPRNPQEEMLAGIWAEVLELSRVGIHDNFFDLGGHSLLATRIVSRVGRAFGMELPVRALFESPTVAGLGHCLQELGPFKQPAAPPITPVPRRIHHPLSFAQERLWFLDQLVPGNSFYNIPTALRLKGRLDRKALARALTEILRRHESLRTTFEFVEAAPVQRIAPPAPIDFPVGLVPGPQAIHIRDLARQEACNPFDLTQGPLMRATLVQRRGQTPDTGPTRSADKAPVCEYVLLITIHHIAADGWSMGVLVRELAALYTAFARQEPSPLPPLAVQYADFAIWQREWLRGEVLQRQLDYWQRQLRGAPPLLILPTDRVRPPVQTFNGDGVAVTVDHALTGRLRKISRKADASLFMTLLAAFNILLARSTGRDDVVVGSPVANRNRQEIEPLIGFFVNTLVLRTNLSGDPGFQALLGRVRQTCLDAYAHQDLPFEKLVDELEVERHLSHNPLVQVAFALQNAPMPSLDLPGLSIAALGVDFYSVRMDLEVHLWESDDGLKGHFMFDADVFRRADIERLVENFQVLLAGIAADPDVRISRCPLVGGAERHRLLKVFNTTQTDGPHEGSIHHLFEAQAATTPDRVALAFEGQRLTYAELNARANQLARYLMKNVPGDNPLMGICVERSLEMVVGILGILKAGGAYVPLDPDYPRQRLAFMLADSAIKILLTQAALLEGLPQHPVPTLCLDRDLERIGAYAPTNPERGPVPPALAYVIYTSGSTGRPKGVMVTHANVMNFLHGFEHIAPSKHPLKGIGVCPFSFDVSVWDLFSNLCFGGELHVVSRQTIADPESFGEYLLEQGITSAYIPPALLPALADKLARSNAKIVLDRLLVGVEPIPQSTLQNFRRLSETMHIINGYGPTETTVCATYYPFRTCLESDRRTPIGRPAPNGQAYLVDEDFNLVPMGVPGELCIGGAGLSRGYLNRPDLTAARFIPDPFGNEPGRRLYRTGDQARWLPGGHLEFLGRVDHQMKVRGFRIEPGEIEAVLCGHPAVAQAVVVSRREHTGINRLVAYVTADRNDRDLQEKLAGWQAEHIVHWQHLYEETYGRVPQAEDPFFNISGWNSSYTNAPIPAEEMAEWVDCTVAGIRGLEPRRVLEIGCGSGLLLSRLAPGCEAYWATDFSPTALDQVAAHMRSLPELSHVRLLNREADDFSGILPGAFDTVILNSVVQYFPGADYLVRVLKGATAALKQGGHLFVGDVRSLPLLKSFTASVQAFRGPAHQDRQTFGRRLRRRLAQETELVIDPRFFTALRARLPEWGEVRVSPKRGRHHNELTRFRYEAVIRKGPARTGPMEVTWLDWREQGFDMQRLRALLSHERPGVLGLKQVPNGRLNWENTLLPWIEDPQGVETLGALQVAWSGRPGPDVDPEALWRLGEALGYDVTLSWLTCGPQGDFDALLRRDARGAPSPLFPQPAECQPLDGLVNNRLIGKLNQVLLPELRALVKAKLPDYMVPWAIMLLARLPLGPNGKVDREALPVPEKEPSDVGKGGRPRTREERILAAIWQETLGLTTIGIHDNFFELGGDSILSIQIISRANQQGMAFKAKDLYQHQTIAELAQATGARPAAARPTLPVAGPAPLTPIQQAFFAQNPVNPNYFNQSVLLAVAPELTVSALKQALEALLAHHGTLRTRFSRNGDGWQQEVDKKQHTLAFLEKDLSAIPAEGQAAALTAHCAAQQKELDIVHGPLMRITFFHLGENRPGRLFLAIHHLVVDGVSWRILLEDLQTAIRQVMTGQPVTLPAVTTPFGQWARRLHAYAQAPALQTQAAFWLALAGAPEPPLPRDPILEAGQNTRDSADQVTVGLDEAETRALIRETPPVYNTGMNDVLLAALWQSLASWTDRDAIRIHLEGHGRADLFPDVDLSRTVGWFTTIFPLSLQYPRQRVQRFAPACQGELLKSIKEQLRRVSRQGAGHTPDDGLGYGVLVHLAKHPALQALPRPEISFNYLGQFNMRAEAGALFEPALEATGPFQDARATRPYVLEINASVVRGQLQVAWTYSRNLHRAQTVTRLAEDFIKALKAIIAHCRSPESGGYTPADFPVAELSQEDLDELMEDLEEMDE